MTPADLRALIAANNVVLGPMAGVTEAPFRGICKRLGAGLTYTEMVGAKALHFNPDSRIARALLTFAPEETPCAVQLYGADPEIMAAQARMVIDRHGEKVACIDVNMGCPVSKVCSRGEGSALMRTPELAAEIVSGIAAATAVPVTVKIRAGWDDSSINAVEFARAMEAAGASAIAIHGRTRKQFYKGPADWGVIARVKAAVAVPVIGSGDVMRPADAKAMLEQTGVDAVMIARGAQGNPWIFQQVRALIDCNEVIPPPSYEERLDMAREHGRALVAFGGERAYKRMRKHVAWYVAGMPGSTFMRDRVFDTTSYTDLEALIDEYQHFLETRRRGRFSAARAETEVPWTP